MEAIDLYMLILYPATLLRIVVILPLSLFSGNVCMDYPLSKKVTLELKHMYYIMLRKSLETPIFLNLFCKSSINVEFLEDF